MTAMNVPIKERFVRFKNRLLGPSFLNDGNHFARVLGRNDFIFWDHIQEKAPYLPLVVPLDNVYKGQVILERIEIEPSPRRMVDLLQGVYNAFAFYSITPEGDADTHWQQFATWLNRQVESDGLAECIKIRWRTEPEENFTPEPIVERYYIPGELEITYAGQDWAEEESKKILEKGFVSRVLRAARSAKNGSHEKPREKGWYEKPFGIVALTVIGGVIVAGIVVGLGWQ